MVGIDEFGRRNALCGDGLCHRARRRIAGFCRTAKPEHPCAGMVGRGPYRECGRARFRPHVVARAVGTGGFRRQRRRQCAHSSGLRPDLERRPDLRRPQDPARLHRLRAGSVVHSVPIPGLCRQHRTAFRHGFRAAGGAGAADRRGTVARAGRSADVTLALRGRAAGAGGGAARPRAARALVGSLSRLRAAAGTVADRHHFRHAAVHGHPGLP